MNIIKSLFGVLVVLGLFFSVAGTAFSQTADVSGSARISAPAPSASEGRIGIQGRFDALNLIANRDFAEDSLDVVQSLFVPIVTPGFRFLDNQLYLGLGFGFGGYDAEDAGGDETSRSAFSFSPLAMYDVLDDRYAALSVGGWLNMLFLGETEVCDPNCRDLEDDAFGIGLSLGAGIRGKISPGLAIGSEFGWGFINISADNDNDLFYHGLFGTILFEASVGI
ncbi:MAG: hypothetical protein JXA30_01560 [Deltaproteobacteria bacterium]|nr:hypothetical protein [Deltaproteobacteria bacterium]